MSYIERRLSKFSDQDAKTATKTVNIPIGGGEGYATFALSDFGFNTSIDAVIRVNVIRKAPLLAASNVFVPSWAITANSTNVGVTLAAGAGTSLQAECMAWGV